MTLGEKQERFQRMITEFKLWLFINGYQVRGGDAFRDPRVHGNMGEKKAYGHRNSCHKLKLAEDLFIFKNGEWLTEPDELEVIGQKWESLGGTWGGRFSHTFDGVHFSLSHGGYK
jgi:hypothetical protein